jgi:hypothetical protein
MYEGKDLESKRKRKRNLHVEDPPSLQSSLHFQFESLAG